MTRMLLTWLGCTVFMYTVRAAEDLTLTIHSEYLSQGGRTHFEADRWDGHNGLDNEVEIEKNKAIGTESGRWIHRDYADGIFEKVTEDPHRKGYPDPNHFKDSRFEEKVGTKFLSNLKGYGFDLDMVMELKEKNWPHWMNTSLHNGTFPNNLDAAADMVLYLLEAINRFTGGHLPPYFEVINEPGTLWETVHWPVIIDYHRIVSKKLKTRFPKLKVGGPTNTGAITNADRTNFKIWKRLMEFMDMSLDHLDFFSFHAYNSIDVKGANHEWGRINEGRLVAVIDLIESYSSHKKGHFVPLIISEYGLGDEGMAEKTSHNFAEWAFSFMHNCHMFTYLNFRGFIDRAIAFLLSISLKHPSASIFYHNKTYTNVAKAYQFWNNFDDSYQFLRVENQYNDRERLISPLALVNPHSKDIYILLHNYQQAQARVKLTFDQHWTHSNTARSTCFFLDSHKTPVLQNESKVSLASNFVTLPPEATCFFVINCQQSFAAIPTVHEYTYYSDGMVIPIKGRAVDVTVNIPSLGNVRFVDLRIGVSTSNKAVQTKPTSARINGIPLTKYYALFEPGRTKSDTLWDLYVYHVPPHAIKLHTNEVRLGFAQDGGDVSTVALIVGKTATDPAIVG